MEKLFNTEILSRQQLYDAAVLFDEQYGEEPVKRNIKTNKQTRSGNTEIEKIENENENESESEIESESESESGEILNYTDIYREYKKSQNCIHTHNKLPVYAYKYPSNTQPQLLGELKNRLLKGKRKKKKAKSKNNIESEEEGESEDKSEDDESEDDESENGIGKRENEKKDERILYHEGDLKIYTPRNFFLKKKKKTLREKIYDGEVMFYEDYIEQKTALDYERFFNAPYKVKRQDEGGKYFFYGKKLEMTQEEDIYRKYYKLDEEYFLNKLKIDNASPEPPPNEILIEKEEVEKVDTQYENLNYKDKSYLLKIKTENKKEKVNTYGFYKQYKHIIFNKSLQDFKKKELINGTIPDIIMPLTTRKKKHPQYCTVPFSRLQSYAISLENLKICPFIHNVMDEELKKNWQPFQNANKEKLRPERQKKGYKKDIYIVNKENLEKSKEKMKKLFEKDEQTEKEREDISFQNIAQIKFQKKKRENQLISGGRYFI